MGIIASYAMVTFVIRIMPGLGSGANTNIGIRSRKPFDLDNKRVTSEVAPKVCLKDIPLCCGRITAILFTSFIASLTLQTIL